MIIAVDTGGTKTLVGLFDADGSLTKQKKFPTPENIDEYIGELVKTIENLTDKNDSIIDSISIALPGTIVNGFMIHAGNLGWKNIDMKGLLSFRFSCPVFVENDANLAGLSEAKAFDKTPRMCLYVTVSTGIGTGIITNGEINPLFAATEGGQIFLEHDGVVKPWEQFASGKAIHRTYGKLASEITDERAWYHIAKNIAAGLLVLCPALGPDVVVIGGGVGTHFAKFSDDLTGIMREYLTDKYMPDAIKQAARPEEAVIYGCYYHAINSTSA